MKPTTCEDTNRVKVYPLNEDGTLPKNVGLGEWVVPDRDFNPYNNHGCDDYLLISKSSIHNNIQWEIYNMKDGSILYKRIL